MRLTSHGAAGEVTGSMHLVEVEDYRILLDCGMEQGDRAVTYPRNSRLPFDAANLTHALLSHAHIDHSGNLPTLIKSGYPGEVICTSATRDLTALMLRDSARIQEQDAAFAKQHASPGADPPRDPLYTRADAEAAIQRFTTREYKHTFFLHRSQGQQVRVTFFDAGHILGSEIMLLELPVSARPERPLRLGFTGDLGRLGTRILRDPTPAPPLDYLIIEGTYGDRLHPSQQLAEQELIDIVSSTTARGGKVVIPAFAVERTQEIVYLLNLAQSGEWHSAAPGANVPLHGLNAPSASNRPLPGTAGSFGDIPIYVDSPLAIDATDIFRLHPECFDDELCEFMLEHHDPWGFRQLHYTRTVQDSKAINDVKGPAVIIASNGMVEAGRVVHHVKHTIADERNTLLFVGYQARGTLGRRIQDGASRIRILGDEVPVCARIATASGFSAHADRTSLLDWVRPIASGLKGVFVVHAEPEAAASFVESLRSLGVPQVVAAQRGASYDLNEGA